MLIEAMADAAVMGGIPRSSAYTFAAQAVLGSAKMVLETGKHPGDLKDMVCSPAGTTIEAVRVLERDGFRSSVIEAMDACIKNQKAYRNELCKNENSGLPVSGSLWPVSARPSAIDNRIFNNQDWVWGIGLLVCGLFYELAVYRFGIKKIRETCINPTSDFKIGRWYDWCIIIYPFFLCVIIAWWLGLSMQWSKNWWTPFAVDNLGTVLGQCAVSILVCILLNRYANKKILSNF